MWSKEDLQRIDLWPVSWNLQVRFMSSSCNASQHAFYCTCIWAFWNLLQASLALTEVNHCILSSTWLFQHKAPRNCAVNLITCGCGCSCYSISQAGPDLRLYYAFHLVPTGVLSVASYDRSRERVFDSPNKISAKSPLGLFLEARKAISPLKKALWFAIMLCLEYWNVMF